MSDTRKTRRSRPLLTVLGMFCALAVGAAGALAIITYTDLVPSPDQQRIAATPGAESRPASPIGGQQRPADRQGSSQVLERSDAGSDRTPVTEVQARTQSPERVELPDLVDRLLPAVVSISVTQGDPRAQRRGPGRTPFNEDFRDHFRNRPHQFGTAVGSGFVIDPSGYIVTNHHVIENASQVRVILHDRTQLDAEIVGEDPRADIALLKVETEQQLPSVPWGDSSGVRVGEDVIAIGNPFGLSSTVTAGIVSARGRFIPSRARRASFVDYIQTDAAINRGNSGGPLFNLRGEVIGINTAIYSNRGTNVGVAFAVPSDIARQVVDQLQRFGRTRRGWLGVTIQDVTPEIAQSLALENPRGALVANVVPDSPAARAGILRGDVIVRFNGSEVADHQRLPRIVAATPSGEEVSVVVWRRGQEVTVKVTLGELETASQQIPGKGTPDQESGEAVVEGMTLSGLSDELRQRFRIDPEVQGVLIVDIDEDSRAAEKGLRPGDIILEANMNEVASPQEVQDQIDQARQADRTSILLLVQSTEGDKRFVALRIDAGQQQ